MVAPIDLSFPFTGRWLTQNSPANRVPSHGTALFGQSYAIDFVPVDPSGLSAPHKLRSFFSPEPAKTFPGFGRLLLAPIDGVIIACHDAEPDHESFRGLPSIGYALTQRRRVKGGWIALAGNHAFIEAHGGLVALCHLQQGSLVVSQGQRVRAGEPLGLCGNSGNSTEPHVHIHAVDSLDWQRARAVPITFNGGLPRNGEVVEVADTRQ